MKVYYWDSETGEDVPCSLPVELDVTRTTRIMNGLGGESFLGIELSSSNVVQFAYKEGAWWMEILDSVTRTGVGCTISLPMALQVIGAIYNGEDAKEWLSRKFGWLEWGVVEF